MGVCAEAGIVIVVPLRRSDLTETAWYATCQSMMLHPRESSQKVGFGQSVRHKS